MMTRVQILDEADSILYSTNTLGEMHESNYSPSNLGQIVGHIGLF